MVEKDWTCRVSSGKEGLWYRNALTPASWQGGKGSPLIHIHILIHRWFPLKNLSFIYRSECSKISLHNYTITLSRGCMTRTVEVSLRCALHSRHISIHKFQIQFKGLFFINLYLSRLIWLRKHAAFHCFLLTRIHGKPRHEKSSDIFISSNSSFIFNFFWESKTHKANWVWLQRL